MDSADSAIPTLGRRSPRLAELRRIARGLDRRRTLIDGLKLVVDAVVAGVPVEAVFTTRAHLAPLAAALAKGTTTTPRLFLLDEGTAARLAPTQHTQGVLAVVARPSVQLRPSGVVAYLDRLQDPGNVGGAIRSAAALGATGVACSPLCADPFSPRSLRASAGQALRFPVQADVSFDELATQFEAAGGQVVGTSSAGGVPLPTFRPRLPALVAFGNEGSGLAPAVAQRCTVLVTIPLAQGVESLNVSVAVALVLAHLGRLVPSPILEGWQGGGDDSTP